MSLQLIFVVEANSRCKSDWIYIKETIEQFYQYSQTEVKLSPVYMDGKEIYPPAAIKRIQATLCAFLTNI